jgi:hypothetical protein
MQPCIGVKRPKGKTMATLPQIAANTNNASASTGPRSAEGKSRSAQNAVKLGIFSLRNIIQPGEEAFYAKFSQALWKDLNPQTVSEQIQAAEVLRASWRLHRIANAEASLGDLPDDTDTSAAEPVLNPETAALQASIDRARQQTLRAHGQAMKELRRLQSERSAVHQHAAVIDRQRVLDGFVSSRHNALTASAKQTQSAPAENPNIPRSAPCPCGSGQKYKRCCGLNAPPVLSQAA